MSDTTITAANSIYTIVVPKVIPVPMQLEGYSSDRAFMTDSVVSAEVQMGVDGRMTAGYTPNPIRQTITLQADSPSKDIFAFIVQTMETSREIYWMSGTITIPSTGETFALTKGVLTEYKKIPDYQKVLQPLDFVITWQSISRSIL